MAGTAIIDGLRALQANRVAIATSYYTPVWRDHWVSFVEACGFDVLLAQSMDQQGLLPESASIEDHGWTTSTQLV